MSVKGLPLFPVTVVGSWARPDYLVEALRKRQRGVLSFSEFNKIADQAVLEALRCQDEAGVDLVSDGEQRRDNFYSFVVEKLDGVTLMSLGDLMDHVQDKEAFDQILRSQDAPSFAIHNATVVDKIKQSAPLALDEFQFMKDHTDKPIRIALPGPYMLTRSMWVDGVSNHAYPTMEDLSADIVSVLRQELIALRDNGCAFVQFDEPVLTDVLFRPEVKERTFMCASMAAASGDPNTELFRAVRLMNNVIQDIDGIDVGLHVCRGNWSRKEEALLNGGYQPMLKFLMAMRLDQLVLEYATPSAGELDAFRTYKNVREIGLGVVNPRTDEIEEPQSVIERVNEALKYFRPDQIYLNPDCGFGTFAERPMNPADVATKKLAVITEAANHLRKEYS